ncbi:MAG: CcdB family protein [Rhodocyclaceae bacterium]|nr:CcdB family protein [Rhodocyclaceae bacterium]
MAQFDVFPNTDAESTAVVPYVLDVQSSFLDRLSTCIVIPLAIPEALDTLPILRLNPSLVIEGKNLVVLTQDMAPVPRRLLRRSVANLSSRREEILAALDFLFTGF